jgi:hypothetical protein
LAWGGAQVESTPGMVAFTLKSTYPLIAVERCWKYVSAVAKECHRFHLCKGQGDARLLEEKIPQKYANAGFPFCRHALLPHCWSRCADANYLTLFWTTEIEMDMLKAQVLGASWSKVNRCTLTLTKEICEICFPFRSHAPDCSAMFSKLCSTPHFTCLCSLLVVFVTCFLLFLCDIRLQLRNDVDCCHSLVQ